ncbi:hypothetical protein AAE02nite_31240 [Adhaeribacter aerolatus]|uniref:Uncharacterized protein n=1 Tax=Adhaeribacter aerolatus TaxID=670289 RepID=A0A512B0G4_9BACT|nr:hypothetical protein [Adhaeribacter aerolatus]GEO05460.1 hypothetical protein AAE02nite_31240 [Adhaeribacter aerolatus]
MIEYFDPEEFIFNFFKEKGYKVGCQVRSNFKVRIYVYNSANGKPFSVNQDLYVSDIYNKKTLTEALKQINRQIEAQLEIKK